MRVGWLFVLAVVAASPVLADDDPHISLPDARTLLARGRTSTCTDIPCLIDEAYAKDDEARALAQALYATTGDVAGTGPEERMDGSYRGTIKLVPQLPIGAHRKHLAWVKEAMESFDAFFAALFPARTTPPAYRWRALQFRFVRSPGKRTPSAYAFGWTVAYNVHGSLLTSRAGVIETMWHELFHTNDFAHDAWSVTALEPDYATILRRCGRKVTCFDAYAPNSTKVRASGMYYAFQPGNGVREYAAELAVRYYREQSQMVRDGKLAGRAFKCGPAENARSWNALIAEFFAGRDLVPACP